MVLLGGKGDADERLVDARVDGHGHGGPGRPLGAEDLEAPVVHGRRDLHGDGIRHATLAGEAVALAHEPVAELELVHDGGRRNHSGDELDAARGAASATAARRLDVHAAAVRRGENGRACIDLEGEPGRKQGQRYRRHFFEDTTYPLTSPSGLPIVTAPHEPLGVSGPQVIREARCSTTPSVGFSG